MIHRPFVRLRWISTRALPPGLQIHLLLQKQHQECIQLLVLGKLDH